MTGSPDQPFSTLYQALTNPRMRQRQTVHVQSHQTLTQSLDCHANNATIQPAGQTMRVLDVSGHALRLYGDDTRWINWRFTSNPSERRTNILGEDISDVEGLGQLEFFGATSLLRCRIDNLANIGYWGSAWAASSWRGVIVQDIGWHNDHPQDPRPTHGHGHGLYTQNKNGGMRLFDGCVWVKGYGGCVRQYGAGNAYARDYTYQNCVVLHDQMLIGGTDTQIAPIGNTHVLNCTLLNAPLMAGYRADSPNLDITIRNCAFVGGTVWVKDFEQVTLVGCVFINCRIIVQAGVDRSAWTWDGNRYYDCTFTEDGGSMMDSAFTNWRTLTGFDANSTYAAWAGALVRVHPVDALDMRGIVAIYNPAELESVEADLSAMQLEIGASYNLRQIRDYDGDVREFTYDGQPVQIAMTGSTQWPKGYNDEPAIPAQALPVYGVFVVEHV